MRLTVELVKELQRRSGEGLMACKKALVVTNGDVNKAIEYLRNPGSTFACVTTSEGRASNMKMVDKISLRNVVEQMFQLIHTKCEIATLVAKNQNAPKYLYQQAADLQDDILTSVQQIEEE